MKDYIISFEDHPDNINYIKIIIKKTGYKHINFISGLDGVKYVIDNHESIFLILMDIRLPDIDGVEATKIIKSKHPEIPIIVQTAYDIDDIRTEMIEAGCNIFLTKPINPKILISKIKLFI